MGARADRAAQLTTSPAARGVERIEAEAWAELQLSLAPGFRRSWGIAVEGTHGAVALVASGTDALTLNRTIGLGFEEPLSDNLLATVAEIYRVAGVPKFIIQLSPAAAPGDAAALLDGNGFRVISHTTKLWRRTDLPASVEENAALEVVEIGTSMAAEYEALVARSLGVPAGLEPGVSSTIGRPGWRYYFAHEHGRPIAGAAMYCRGEYAWFGLAATVESARGKGAQTALLTRRLRDAKAVGCVWATADTLAETPGRANQSLRNMRRLGFVDLYDRPNFVGESGVRVDRL